jgi:cytochrome b subunit of formate dehydrogenase
MQIIKILLFQQEINHTSMFCVFTVHLYASFYHQTTVTVFPGTTGLEAELQLGSSGIRTEML